MITWEIDSTEYFDNIVAHDMYADGERTYAWMCYYKFGKRWRFKGDSPDCEFPYRATRAEAEADAFAWWAAKQLEKM